MKAEVLQESFQQSLNTAIRFIATRAQLPILSNVLIRTKKTRLEILATNLEMSLLFPMGAKILEEGEISVPAKTLYELVSNLKKGPISLEAEKEELKIKSEGVDTVILGVNTADFPVIPSELSDNSIKLDQKVFTEIIEKILFSVSTEETRPVLTGVLFSKNNGGVDIVSSDGFRLSLRKLEGEGLDFSKNVIIPRSVLVEVGKLAKDTGQSVGLSVLVDTNQIVFEIGSIIVSSRLIEGQFPDFSRIIPQGTILKVRVDKQEFLRAIKLSSIFARDVGNVVLVKFTESNLSVSAQSGKTGTQKASVNAKIDGDYESVSEISFNYRFLEDLIGSVSGEELLMEFVGKEKPGLFKDPKDPNFLHVIMPVKISS